MHIKIKRKHEYDKRLEIKTLFSLFGKESMATNSKIIADISEAVYKFVCKRRLAEEAEFEQK